MCWACWESIETQNNPLIRACLGCKSIELQFIHRECINKYLTNLLITRAATLGEGAIPGLPYLDTGIVRVLTQEGTGQPTGMIAAETDEKSTDFDTKHATEDDEESQNLLARQIPRGWKHLDNGKIRCTRCMDQYIVALKPVSPLRVLFHDRLLKILTILMTLCVIVLLFACGSILYQAQSYLNKVGYEVGAEHLKIQVWGFPEKVDIRMWSLGMCSIFIGAYAITLVIVFRHLRGFFDVQVINKKQ